MKSFASFANQTFLSRGCLAAFLAGILLPFAFLPFHAWWLAIFSPAFLLAIWDDASPREAFQRGFWYGLGCFGVGVSWIYVSIHQYGDTDMLLAGFLTLIFIVVLALFPALQGYTLQRFFNDHKNPYLPFQKALLYFPTTWLFTEWFRSWVLTGFPWLQLGHSQVDSWLGGFAPIWGVFGVTFIVAFLSGLGYLLVRQRRPFIPLVILGIFLTGWGLTFIRWTTPQSHSIRVALVQGNISQSLKWSPAETIHILKLYPQLSRDLWQQHDLVIWPEAAITLPLPMSARYINRLLNTMKPYSASLITGIPVASLHNGKYYNAMILIGNAGIDVYYKRYLVPFGEYVPFERWLRGLIRFFDLPMSDFIRGAGGEIDLKNKQGLSIAPFLCYEIAFPNAILTTTQHANLMVVLSNDTWFGHSFAPAQHLQIAQFAALAAGRSLLVSTNDGITAVIDSKGKVTQQIPRFQEAVLESQVLLMEGKTPWMRFGHYYLLIWLGLGMFFCRIKPK